MQNVFEMSAGTRDAYERAVAAAPDDAVFRLRFERFFPEFYEPLERLYGAHPAFEEQLAAILATMVGAHADRDPALRRLDHEREITADWFQRQRHSGYIAYVDRFAGTLTGVREHVSYLRELGVTYLHLMPLLRRARARTTAATRSPTIARSTLRWARWTTCARSPPTSTPAA